MDRALGYIGLKEVLYLIPPYHRTHLSYLPPLYYSVTYHTLFTSTLIHNQLDFDHDNPTDFESLLNK